MTNKNTTPSPLLVVGLDRKVRGEIMENIKDDVWRDWHKKWEADAAKHLGKEKLTFDEKRIAYFAWREAIEMCNAEIEASNIEVNGCANDERKADV